VTRKLSIVFVRFRAPLHSSLSKEHLSLGLNVSLNEKNEVIIYAINPMVPFQTTKIKKGDQITVSNKKETYIVSCATIESIATMILSSTNKTITLTLRNSGKILTLQLRNN
jgi:carboxyl-terminal processing protease